MPAENYPGELNERRARELLIWAIYNGKVKAAFKPDGSGLVVSGVDTLAVETWAKPT